MTIHAFLKDVGLSPNLLGYHYLGRAIELAMDKFKAKDYNFSYTVIYKDIADEMNTTSSRVERAIRHVIELAFNTHEKKLYDMFGELISTYSGKVTNSCFIATVAEYFLKNEVANRNK